MNVIQNVSVVEDITLISLQDSPADINVIAEIFEKISDNGIDVDMISQTPPHSHIPNLSFTISDDDIGKILKITGELREIHPDIKLTVRSGNCKISVFGEAMKGCPGVAVKVFNAIATANAEVSMITTSEVDISLLLDKQYVNDALESIKNEFNL